MDRGIKITDGVADMSVDTARAGGTEGINAVTIITNKREAVEPMTIHDQTSESMVENTVDPMGTTCTQVQSVPHRQ